MNDPNDISFTAVCVWRVEMKEEIFDVIAENKSQALKAVDVFMGHPCEAHILGVYPQRALVSGVILKQYQAARR